MSTPSAGSGFPAFTEDDWRVLVARATRGRAPADLATETDDGIPLGPIYGRDPGGAAIGGEGGPWTIVQRIDLADIAAARSQIGDDLGGGAGGIDLLFATSPSARHAGLPATRSGDIDRLLADIGDCALRVDAGEATHAIASGLLDLADRRGAAGLDLTLSFDPIASLAATGRLRRPFEAHAAEVAGSARRMEEVGAAGAAVVADGRLWHAGGASEVQELAVTLAAFVAHLRMIESGGIALDRAVRRVAVALAADADQFLTIAKFRAARLLLAHALESARLSPTPIRIHAETAWRMMSRRDPHVNILRTSVAAFAAGIGGADSVTVLPFDAAGGVADAFARRLARNSQTILIAEANLARVADPAAGSGAAEALTEALAQRAWDKFRAIEAAGGLLAAVRAGTIQREVGATRQARIGRVANGAVGLVGTTLFPDQAVLPVAPLPTTGHDGAANAESAEALVFNRLAEPFE